MPSNMAWRRAAKRSAFGSAPATSAINLTKAVSPDLLLLDIAMPGLDGIGVARALTEQDPSPAVVFVTAFDQFAVAAFEVEAVDYLMKPVDPNRLQRALDRARNYLLQRSAQPAAGKASQWLDGFLASDPFGLGRDPFTARGPGAAG